MSCSLHPGRDLSYLEWHNDSEQRHSRGEKQRQCPKCKKWVWESLYYKKEAGDE